MGTMDVGVWAAGLPTGFGGAATRALEAARVEVERLYARWADLEAKQA